MRLSLLFNVHIAESTACICVAICSARLVTGTSLVHDRMQSESSGSFVTRI